MYSIYVSFVPTPINIRPIRYIFKGCLILILQYLPGLRNLQRVNCNSKRSVVPCVTATGVSDRVGVHGFLEEIVKPQLSKQCNGIFEQYVIISFLINIKDNDN